MREWGRGNVKIFRRKLVYLTVTKNFVGQHYIVSLYSGHEEFYASEVMPRFSEEIILSHSAQKISRGTLLCRVQQNSGSHKVYG